MYKMYPVSLPFGRDGGSQETIIVFIELITALISAGAVGAKNRKCNFSLTYQSEREQSMLYYRLLRFCSKYDYFEHRLLCS